MQVFAGPVLAVSLHEPCLVDSKSLVLLLFSIPSGPYIFFFPPLFIALVGDEIWENEANKWCRLSFIASFVQSIRQFIP